MHIQSTSLAEGETFSRQQIRRAIGGSDLSPQVSWTNPPAGTSSFVLSMVDPHPVARDWVHWLVTDIPGDVRALPEGASGHIMPPGSHELDNSFGEPGYGGPQPPTGSGEHPYVLTVYALAVDHVDLPRDATVSQIREALKGKVLGAAHMTGVYER